MSEPFIVGIRFNHAGKVYHFDASAIPDLRVGDHAVVETSRGWQLGEVIQLVSNPTSSPDGQWKPVNRRATPRDLMLRLMWQSREADVITTCRKRASELVLEGVKIVGAEYSFDGSRLTILFSTETEEKVDLKSLRSDMQRAYPQSQCELRQIGPRDVAKMIGGMGACGLESRCCSRYLTEFCSISIRMAKEQGISLTPTEITGMCGRLRCCLYYEYDFYQQAKATMPKRNKRVMTPKGEGRVVDIAPLRDMIMVELPELGVREFPKDEVTLIDESENKTRPVDAPAAKEKVDKPEKSDKPERPERPDKPERTGDKK